jgi:ATP-dependent protease ClpP protease subunit
VKIALFVVALTAAPVNVCPVPFDDYTLSGPISQGEEIFFQAWLKTAKNPRVLIHSPGGSMGTSLAMMDAITAHGSVRCEVRGVAASGAFGVLQACKWRAVVSSGRLMTHEPSVIVPMPIDREFARMLCPDIESKSDQWNRRMGARLKVSPEEYDRRVLGQDWNLTAKEALAVGAVDEILP